MSRIRIGWSEKDVSTDKPINIPGQFNMRISRGILDPLKAAALVLRDGDSPAIFLSVDTVDIRAGLYDEVRAKTAALCSEIPAEKILMNATHTHTGASHARDADCRKDFATGEPVPFDQLASSDEYRDFLSTACAEAICEAWTSAAEGAVAWGYGYAVVAHNRRTTYLDDVSLRGGNNGAFDRMIDGHAAMYGPTNDPNFSGYEAGADPFTNFLYTFDSRGNLTGAVVNIPCPSQNSEHEYRLSADFWHDIRQTIRARHGEHVHILGQCAAAGDLSPRILHYLKAQERRFRLKYGLDASDPSEKAFAERMDIAERVADSFDEVLGWARKDLRAEAAVRHEVREFQLSRRLITEEEYDASRKALADLGPILPKTDGTPVENLNVNSTEKTLRERHEWVLKHYELQKTEPKLPMLAHVVRVGDVAFASNRFELYMDFQHRIQARSPFEQTFIVQLAAVPGEEGGTYLPTSRGLADKGYSACPFDNECSPEGGQELVEQTLEVLCELKEAGRGDRRCEPVDSE